MFLLWVVPTIILILCLCLCLICNSTIDKYIMIFNIFLIFLACPSFYSYLIVKKIIE